MAASGQQQTFDSWLNAYDASYPDFRHLRCSLVAITLLQPDNSLSRA
jgi:hypothetical protein